MAEQLKAIEPGLSAALKANLETLFHRVYNDTAKRKLWSDHLTDGDREKFQGDPLAVRGSRSILEIWHIARGTPTWNECLVEVAYELGFIRVPQREKLLADLGSTILATAPASPHTATVPRWDKEARELRYRGTVVRRVARPRQAFNIVTILDAFEAAGWPPRIDDPHKRKPDNETRRRDVSNLNRGLDTLLMKFACDGNGTGFMWMAVPSEMPVHCERLRSQ